MPLRRRKPRVKTRRRRPVKYQKKKSSKMTLIKNPSNGGFPTSCFTQLKIEQAGVLNPGVAGINAIEVFRANGLYDPYVTGAGNQPRGFDQWMTIYDHWYVKRSKIIVELHNGDSTNEMVVGVAIRDDTTTEVTTNEYAEQNAITKMLGRVGSSHNHAVITRYFNYAKQNFQKYVCEQNRGTISADPQEQGFFHVFAGSPWGQDAANAYYTVKIIYDVLFTELKDVPPS